MVRPRYYTPNEVALHNTPDDLWTSFLGKVYDLTPLCEKHKGVFKSNLECKKCIVHTNCTCNLYTSGVYCVLAVNDPLAVFI